MEKKTTYNLVPSFIQQKYANNELEGQFDAFTLFMDISGFTAMAQSFVHHDKEGTEELAQIINRIFEPIILIIYENGGFVAGFAGDALTVIFPNIDQAVAHRTCATTIAIRQIIEDVGSYQTSLGDFKLAVKQGVSAGKIEWGIIGPDDHKTYYFRGQGIENCIEAEKEAVAGQIIITSTLKALLPIKTKVKDIDDKFLALESIDLATLERNQVEPIEIEKNIRYRFFPDFLWQYSRYGEFRQVAVVFIAFKADLSKKLLRRLICAAVEDCDRFGGHFIEVDFGDKGGVLLSCFGAPKSHENDSERALSFSLSITNQLNEFGIDWQAGVTYGQVYAGMVGSKIRGKYAVMGNVVNLAARLMAKATSRQILVSDAVTQQSMFRFDAVGQYQYKGFVEPILTYQLASRTIFQEQQDVTGSPFVGRTAEYQQLSNFAQPLLRQKPAGVAIIYGEAGIGKTLLVSQLKNNLNSSVKWFLAPADQIFGQAFNPFITCLKKRFQQKADATQDENKAAFIKEWQALAEQLSDNPASKQLIDQFDRTLSIIGALLDLYWPNSLYEQLDRELRYENSLTAIKMWLFVESILQPTVLFLEDGHWLDQASHELIQSLSQEMASYPLLVIITSRYEDDGLQPDFELSTNSPKFILELSTLTGTAVYQQAEQIIGGGLSDNLANILHQRTEGNPFFVQQLIYYFQDHNLFKRDENNNWTVSVEETPLPATINAILVARIDRLLESAKEVVQTAAVLGREFEIDVLAEMLQTNIEPEVKEAQNHQIWRTFNNLKYIFNHVMLRDAAYDMQLREQLRKLHILAARAYERLHSNNLAPYFAALAYHYRVAEAPEKESQYALLAGKHASSKGNQKEAISHFNRAIELSESSTYFDLLLLREDSYHILGDREKQAEDITKLSQIAFENSEAVPNYFEKQTEAILRQTRYRSAISDYTAAIVAAQSAIKLSQKAGGLTQEIQSRYWWGEALEQQGHYLEAIKQFNIGLKLLRAKPDPAMKARMLKELGWIAFRQGDAILCIEKLGEALLTAQLSENRREEMAILKALGGAANVRGDYKAAQAWQLQGLAIAHEIGHRQQEGSMLNNLGNTNRFLGEYEIAASYYQRSLTLLRKTGWRMGESISNVNLGLVLPKIGKRNEAFYYAQSGVELAQNIQARMVEASGWYALGNIASDEQRWEDAEIAYKKGIEINSQLALPHSIIEAKGGLLRIYLKKGQNRMLLNPLTDILAYLGAGNSVQAALEPIRIYLSCYEALKALGDPRADRILREAYTLLNTQMGRLPNQNSRQVFRENIQFHRAIFNAWQAQKIG